MAEQENTSPDVSATQQSSGPATGNSNASSSATLQKPPMTLEEALHKLADLEHSSKNATEEVDRHRKKLTAYEKAEKERETAAQAAKDAELGELERTKKHFSDLQSEYDTFKKQMQDRIVRYEIEAQANKLGIIDPEAASALLNKSLLEYSEDGSPNNAEKLLKDLIKNKPYLAPKLVETVKEEPASPAQTATQQKPPAVPAMNPGRSQISSPTSIPAQGPYRPPSWGDIYNKQ